MSGSLFQVDVTKTLTVKSWMKFRCFIVASATDSRGSCTRPSCYGNKVILNT